MSLSVLCIADVPAPWIVLEYLQNGDIKHFLMVS